MQILLSASANVNQAANDGASPLFIASQYGHCEVVQVLLSANANVNQADYGGWIPLDIASQHGHCDVVQVLLCASAEVNSLTDKGHSPLMLASHYGQKSVVKLLLKHQANANTRCPKWESFKALHFAALAGHRSIVNLLIPFTELGEGELAEFSGEGMSSELRAKLRLRQCAGCERLQSLGEDKFKRCAKCKSVAYCNRACQVKHWKTHKPECLKEGGALAGAST